MCGQLPGESEQAKGVETEQPVGWGGNPGGSSFEKAVNYWAEGVT